jgi:ABC-type oligopeptide transport system substrate-binding subunit
MKTLSTFRTVAIIFSIIFLLSQTSCIVFSKKDNGKHKGWYKNTNNPHHPNSTNPGKSKGNSNGNSNGNSKVNSKK